MKAMESQGFFKNANGVYEIPANSEVRMVIDSSLIPKCPVDRSGMTMNLRSDDTFLEDEGWHRASAAYSDFLRRHENMHVLFLELGVGANTPVIVKYPSWQMTMANKKSVYACLNYGEAFCPGEIEDRSICIDGDIGEIFQQILKNAMYNQLYPVLENMVYFYAKSVDCAVSAGRIGKLECDFVMRNDEIELST